MEHTYCGKSCEDCGHREALSCPGCMAGPGKKFYADCEIAKCCLEKGHESCVTCSFRSGCGKIQFSKNAPSERIRRQERLQQKKETLHQQASFLSKWLWYMVWPTIIIQVVSILELIPLLAGLSGPFSLITMACNLLYAYVLIQISPIHDNFRHAGWIFLVVGIVSLFNIFLNHLTDSPAFALIVLLPSAGFSLFGQYLEMTAFGEILTDVEQSLSDRWFFVRKWYFLGFAVILGGTFVTFFIPLLGLLAVFGGCICLLLMTITKIVALYNTAEAFGSY